MSNSIEGTVGAAVGLVAEAPVPGDSATAASLEARVRQLVEGYPAGDPATDGDQAKVAALYAGFMDESAIEALGAKPLAPKLAAIRAATDRDALATLMGESQGDYIDTGVAMRIGNDRRGLSLTLTNLFDSRGNRFSLGTPFVEGNEGFMTPLRPRTLRIAVDVAY